MRAPMKESENPIITDGEILSGPCARRLPNRHC
jgi:hypothetical protein